MQTMQTIPSTCAAGSTSTNSDGATGILEDSNGVTTLICNGKKVARCKGVKRESRVDTLTLQGGQHALEWELIEIESLTLDVVPALMRSQGLSFQRLLDPCVLLFAQPRPMYSTQPGADRVFLAIIRQCTAVAVPPFELFSVLLQCVKDRLPLLRLL